MGDRGSATNASALNLVITREFDAPRKLVWRAWTENEHLLQWSCPTGFAVTFGEGDLRPGGKWRSGMRALDGTEYRLGGEYREIVAPEKLVFTHAWEDASGTPGHQTLVTVGLAERAGKTVMTFEQTGFASREGHEGGWTEAFENLAAYLTDLLKAGAPGR